MLEGWAVWIFLLAVFGATGWLTWKLQSAQIKNENLGLILEKMSAAHVSLWSKWDETRKELDELKRKRQ